MLGLPDAIDIHTPSGDVVRDQPMWTYWNLQEGEITVDPLMFATADGGAPPVIHLDTDAPLHTDDGRSSPTSSGASTTSATGTASRAAPHRSPSTATSSSTRIPRRPTSTHFPDMWCAALSHAMCRFEGCRPLYKPARSGGVGAFTADNFPVFDWVKPNVYASSTRTTATR